MTHPLPRLSAPGWLPAVRERLEALLRNGSGQGLPVVFDFDNTIVCGDIGEATLAMLVRDGVLEPGRVPELLGRSFVTSEGRLCSIQSSTDLTEYYEALLAPTAHGRSDPTPLATGYTWAVEVMQGLRLSDVVRATQKVLALSQPGREQFLTVTPGHSAYPVPFFYPEVVELITELRRHRFEIWIVSASNVWSVRCLVSLGLNPLLREAGVDQGIPPGQVVGVSTLMTDDAGRLYKDAVMIREREAYAALDLDFLDTLRLTSWLQYPVPTYSGKVGVIWDVLGRRPYLAAGDSPGDHAMLSFSENRLWIARLEKPDYQQATLRLIDRADSKHWLIQPVLCRKTPSFISDLSRVPQVLGEPPVKVRESIALIDSLANQRS